MIALSHCEGITVKLTIHCDGHQGIGFPSEVSMQVTDVCIAWFMKDG